MVGVMRGIRRMRTGSTWSSTGAGQGGGRCQRILRAASSGTWPGGEAGGTTFTLWSEADCQILSALAASFLESLISSFIRWVWMFEGRWLRKNPLTWSIQSCGSYGPQQASYTLKWMASLPLPGWGISEPGTSGRGSRCGVPWGIPWGTHRDSHQEETWWDQNLSSVRTVEGPHAVVEFGEAGSNAPDSELGLHLGKPNPSIICPELRELDSDGVDVEGSWGGSGWGFGYRVGEGQMLKKKALSIWRLEVSWYGENRDGAQTN